MVYGRDSVASRGKTYKQGKIMSSVQAKSKSRDPVSNSERQRGNLWAEGESIRPEADREEPGVRPDLVSQSQVEEIRGRESMHRSQTTQ